ncbi:MAG: hypothetical protein DRM99_00465 [Thermoplasmata archaeon]|nr:MAG: hypothetical protein DRM99_00465 [Thermoplasmata archaeon]
MKDKKISVIIPAYDASKTIGKVLKALINQNYPNYDVFIIDDCPEHPIEKQIKNFQKHFKHLYYLKNRKNIGLAKSINKGIRLSKSDIIVILHDDCVPLSKNWLNQLKAGFIDEKVAVVTSRFFIDFNRLNLSNKIFSYIYNLGEHLTQKNKKPLKNPFKYIDHIGDKCDAFRRNILEKIGLFDETFSFANEDTDISNKILKSGHKIVLNRNAHVIHIFSETQRQFSIITHMKKALQLTKQSIYVFLRHKVGYKLDCMLALIFVLIGFLSNIHLLNFILIFLTLFFSRIFFTFVIVLYLTYFLVNFLYGSKLMYSLAYIAILYLLLKSLYKSFKYIKDTKKLILAIPIFIFSLIWDILAGIGWIRGTFIYLFKNEKRKK